MLLRSRPSSERVQRNISKITDDQCVAFRGLGLSAVSTCNADDRPISDTIPFYSRLRLPRGLYRARRGLPSSRRPHIHGGQASTLQPLGCSSVDHVCSQYTAGCAKHSVGRQQRRSTAGYQSGYYTDSRTRQHNFVRTRVLVKHTPRDSSCTASTFSTN